MGKLNQDMADMKEIREADRRWLCVLFGEPYEAKFQSGGVHVYDGNGDEFFLSNELNFRPERFMIG